MEKIRIMHFMLSLEVGGLENGVVNTVRLLDHSRYSPYVCCLERVGHLAGRVDTERVRIINLNKGKGFSPCLFLKLARILRREKIQILHTHCWATLLYGIGAVKIAGTPAMIHGEHGIFNLDSYRRRRLYGHLLRGVTQILTVSDSLRRDVIKITKQRDLNIRAIINGVDTERFEPADKGRARRRFGIKQDDFVVGSVGRLDPIKKYENLIRCVAAFQETDVKGVLIGDGLEKGSLESLASDLNLGQRFLFLGRRMDVHEILPILDVFVLSSVSEGLSNTILEAMASGLPVVATDVGGNGETVIHGKTGFLVPSNSPEALYSALKKLKEDRVLAHEMGRRGRERAEKAFSLKRMAHEYQEVYEDLYSRKVRRGNPS